MSKIEELEKQIQDLTAQYEKKVYDLEQLICFVSSSLW